MRHAKNIEVPYLAKKNLNLKSIFIFFTMIPFLSKSDKNEIKFSKKMAS